MKNLLLSFLMIGFAVLSFAQETTKEPVSQSESVEFLSNSGLFVLREYYELGEIKSIEFIKGVRDEMDCRALIMTNLKDNTKMGCFRFEIIEGSIQNSVTLIGTIDADELDACIQILKYISNNLLPTKPAIYTEVEYITRDNVKIGAFFSDKASLWHVYTTFSNTRFIIDPLEIPNLINKLERAKYLIKDKTAN